MAWELEDNKWDIRYYHIREVGRVMSRLQPGPKAEFNFEKIRVLEITRY